MRDFYCNAGTVSVVICVVVCGFGVLRGSVEIVPAAINVVSCGFDVVSSGRV